jgi:hypothetical protein
VIGALDDEELARHRALDEALLVRAVLVEKEILGSDSDPRRCDALE